MEFTLYYRGGLKSNGRPRDKQNIRRELHPQLKKLWELEPLSSYKKFLGPSRTDAWGAPEICLLERVGNSIYAPLVSSKLFLAAELDIILLRPEKPGNIFISGDIDNRLKTLLDALTVPRPDQIADQDLEEPDWPTFCLLQDDKLVTGVRVGTDRLLVSANHQNEVVLIIKVKTRVTKHTMTNTHFA